MDFRTAFNTAAAELTPQPWEWTDGHGATLTVIPAGLRADRGQAEVMVRITASKTVAAEVGVTTSVLPGMVAALTDYRPWDCSTVLDGLVTVGPAGAGGMVVVVTETDWDDDNRPHEVSASVLLPADQRLPLASALRRALDVARGWED